MLSIVRSFLQLLGLGKPGLPGQKDGDLYYCPLVQQWIGWTWETEISGTRTNFDDIEDFQNFTPDEDDRRSDFYEAALSAGWKLPEQLGHAVLTCGFCEAYCLGKSNGPENIPPVHEIDRTQLRKRL